MKMFIPIESVELYNYLAYSQLIIPYGYIKRIGGEGRGGIQTHFPNQILLSKNKWVNNTHLSKKTKNIEVSITVEVEENLLIDIGDGFFLLDGVLPISVIQKVTFRNKDQMQVTIGNMTISSSFIPKEWVEFDDNSPKGNDFILDNLKCPVFETIDLSIKLKKFNKIMGGLASIKNEFPKDVENLLNFFTHKDYQDNNMTQLFIRDIGDKRLKDIVFSEDQDIYMSNDIVKEVAKEENIELEWFCRRVTNRDELIDKNIRMYRYAILNAHRYLLSSNIIGLTMELSKMKEIDIEEYKYILFLYGVTSGYRKMPFREYMDDKQISYKFDYDDGRDFNILNRLFSLLF